MQRTTNPGEELEERGKGRRRRRRRRKKRRRDDKQRCGGQDK